MNTYQVSTVSPIFISLTCFACFPLYQFISAYSFSDISRSQWPISSRTTCNRFVLIVQLSLRYPSVRRIYEFVGWLEMETRRNLPKQRRQNLLVHVKQPLQPVL